MEHVTSEGIIVTNRVFVGGIPSWMNEIELQLEFEELNLMVKSTRIVEDMKTGRPKGYGFVTFFDAKVAEELIREGHLKTKDGLRFRISTAIRKKALELRHQKCQMNSNLSQCILQPANNVQYLPIQTSQAQIPNMYQIHGGYYILNSLPEQRYTSPQLYAPLNPSSVMFYNI